jgi:hypothetical protein
VKKFATCHFSIGQDIPVLLVWEGLKYPLLQLNTKKFAAEISNSYVTKIFYIKDQICTIYTGLGYMTILANVRSSRNVEYLEVILTWNKEKTKLSKNIIYILGYNTSKFERFVINTTLRNISHVQFYHSTENFWKNNTLWKYLYNKFHYWCLYWGRRHKNELGFYSSLDN